MMSVAERVAEHEAEKYEAWAAEIEKLLANYAKLRRQVRYLPFLALVTAPLGFIWSSAVAFMIALSWLAIWATTLYITYMRTWQYKKELLLTYDQVERLRHPPTPADSPA